VSPLRRLLLLGAELQVVADVDPLDHQDSVLGLDLAGGLGPEPSLSCRDPARLQRAPEGASESAGRGGDDVVKRGGMRLVAIHGDAVVPRDGPVNTE
jgi:hypothetical protein